MTLLKSIPIVLFIFISSWTSAMCEDGFSSEEILISFAKKQMGEKIFEKELGNEWSQKITQKTKNWNRADTSQFLDFLIHRFGEENTLEVLKAFLEFEGIFTPNEFINRVTFYDQINKNIVNHILLFHADFDMLMTNSNPSHIKNIYSLIESYIGAEGASYVMWHLLIYRDMLSEAIPKEMRKVMWFVADYTNKHGVTTDTPTNKVGLFKAWVSRTNRKPSEIQFENFREFIEFNKIVAETLNKQAKGEEDNIHGKGNIDLFLLQFELYFKVSSLFFGFYHTNYHNLKKTINILREYITPTEIAELLMNEPGIYSVDPKNLQAVINILKNIYVATEQSPQSTQKTGLQEFIITYVTAFIVFSLHPEKRDDVADYIDTRRQKKGLKEFIGSMIKEHSGILLSADPINLRNTIALLEQITDSELFPTDSSPKENNATTLRMVLLIMNFNYSNLERLIDTLGAYLDRKEITHIITKYFPSIDNKITEETLDSVEQILKIFDKYIDKQDTFLQRVGELFVLDSQFIPELHKQLTEMADTLDPNTMQRKLFNFSLSEILPSPPLTLSSPHGRHPRKGGDP